MTWHNDCHDNPCSKEHVSVVCNRDQQALNCPKRKCAVPRRPDPAPAIWLPRPPSPSEPPSRLRRHLPLYSPPATPKILPHRVHPPTSLVPASSPCPPPEITSPTQPRPLPSKPELSHRLVSLHAKLQTPSGPNAFTLRLPVPSNLNIPEWRRRLTAYPDRVICEFLEFGWPVGYSSPSPPSSSSRNHGSARAQPNIVQSYLDQSHVRCRSHVRPLHVQPALHTPHRFSSPDRPEPLRQISACRRPQLPPRDIR